jgi:hypothetical protein
MEKLLYGIFPNETFVDLSLYQFGYEECDPLHSFGPARRNHFLFHYILSGIRPVYLPGQHAAASRVKRQIKNIRCLGNKPRSTLFL